ncbi:TonB-dependent receptor [Flavisolibacter sp. BT320]|nr:TonB-dependent receptor [Flavisolibacter longurius]
MTVLRNRWTRPFPAVPQTPKGWRSYYWVAKILLIILLVSNATFANGYFQAIEVKGKVTDENNLPLSGVSVAVKGGSAGTTTNETGDFRLTMPSAKGVLVFSNVGYVEQEIPVNGQSNVNVTLQKVVSKMDEVVVVGYGTQKRANLTGSVTVIETSDLGSRPFSSTASALQGLAPGVTVTNSSGAPGSEGAIRIRGIGTLNNSNPLVLIDGVEGDMNTIDPNIIASINVLKDAASAAIYGSRAANGVILVTTKRASGGFKINYHTYVGVQKPTDLPQKVNAIDHMEMINLAHKNSGASPLFTQAHIENYKQNMAANPDLYPNTDWQKEVLRGSGLMHSHNLSINTGGGKFRLLTTASYLNQKGIIETSDFKRYTFRNNADFTISDKLSLQADVQLIKAKTVEPGSGLSSVFLQMNRIPAIQPGRYSNGLYGEAWNGENPIAFSGPDGGSQIEELTKLLGRFVLNYKPTQWLSAELLAQPRYEELYNDNYNRAIQTYQQNGSPLFIRPERSTLANRSIRYMYGNYYGYLTASHTINRHGFKLLLGSSVETYLSRNFRAYRDGFTFPDYRVLDAGLQDNREASGNASEWALQSFFGRLNYNFDSKYLIEVNGRYDGSSRFAKGNRFGFFPSVSAGWRLSSEDFMMDLSAINNLMIRGSWGRLGNQNIGNYPFASTLSLGSYTLGGQILQIAALNEMNNEQISWETSEMTNVGFDATLLKNLSVSFDWYNKITYDILLRLDIPTSIGLSAPYQNAGKVQNRGWDATVNYKGVAGQFRYGIAFNLSDVRNTVLDLRGVSQSGLQVSREGYPMNSIFALEADGYFQSAEEIAKHVAQIGVLAPGDIRYVNQNQDNIINADDYKIVGSTIPRFTYGLNLNAEFENITFNAFLQGVGKADGYLYGRAIQPFFSGASTYEQHKDYWTEANRNASFPRLTWGDAGNNYQHSSFWMKDASYLRLKNIQLGYNLPKQFLSRLNLEQARVYVNGLNLLTFDSFWDGFDVETPVGTGTNYPMVKTFTLGVDLRF